MTRFKQLTESAETLSDYLSNIPHCERLNDENWNCAAFDSCRDCWLEWLQQEVRDA